MNQWNFIIGMSIILLLLIIVLFVSTIMILIPKTRQGKGKGLGIIIGIDSVFVAILVLYWSSHSTYYKYNDWEIIGSSIYSVKESYGEFDLGEIHENKSGRVAYYIYKDTGPILPDSLDHYYYIDYDENGIVYNVFDGCQPGG